jgi:RES domain
MERMASITPPGGFVPQSSKQSITSADLQQTQMTHPDARRCVSWLVAWSVHLGDIDAVDTPMKASILDKDSYTFSQRFGSQQRSKGSDGLVYPSVRHDGGWCIAAFWPDTVGIPVQERHLQYEWDGTRVSRYFDFKQESWVSLV